MILRFENLVRRFGAHLALDGATGNLSAGEIIALTGENGSGKSTLLLTLAGILKPHRGKVTISGGADLHLVAHQPMAYTELSILRNLELAATLSGKKETGIAAALEYWQIDVLKGKNLNTLSRGQLQRFLLARAMVAAAKILLLDEPFTGLDTRSEKLLVDFIAGEKERGVAVLFSEHDATRARRISTREIHMLNGQCRSESQR